MVSLFCARSEMLPKISDDNKARLKRGIRDVRKHVQYSLVDQLSVCLVFERISLK